MEYIEVRYKLTGSRGEARAMARDICYEQTVEFPSDLLTDKSIKRSVVGEVETVTTFAPDSHEAVIHFPAAVASKELTQLLNLLYGNISIKPGIRLLDFTLPGSLYKQFKGPRFGYAVRELAGVNERRALLSTALKPMGLSAENLAELAYKFALGGIDIIKDDHGLSDQEFAPYRKRVELCQAAVEKANRETGGSSIYVPNITAGFDQLPQRLTMAAQTGILMVLVSPFLTGLDGMRWISEQESHNCAVLSHPAFSGTYVISGTGGISHRALYGKLMRLAGADGVIYPNFGGRFSFTREECESIVSGLTEESGQLKPAFPVPGGGMTMERIPEMVEVYGNDVIYLVGGGLFRHSDDLVENCRYFRKMVST
jgi:ribulose-bisphosphate carboxylase large chain